MATKVSNGLDLASQRIINLGDPTGAQDATTKNYVDAVARGLDWKASVRAASTGNVTVSSAPSALDGVTLAANDRVLLKDQTAGAENGIYVFSAAAAALVRAVDADSSAEVTSGMAATVTEGTINDNRVFMLTTADPITLGTTALAFSQLGGSSSAYVAGNGLTESPAGTFNVGAGTGLTITADAVAIDTAVVPRKFATNVGDGTSTAITVTHNFGTRDVMVELYLATTPWDRQIAEITLPSVNTATFTFSTAPAAAAYRAVITG